MALRALALIGSLAICAGAFWVWRFDRDHQRALAWGRSFRQRYGVRVAYLTVAVGLALMLWLMLAIGDTPSAGPYSLSYPVGIGGLVILLTLAIGAYVAAVWRGK